MTIQDPKTFAIIGAAMEVHKELGFGFLEAVYQDALEYEFVQRNIPFYRERAIPITYKDIKLNTSYRADFICYDSVIVELKAIKALTQIEEAQVINYLKGTHFNRAILFNFGTPKMEYKRLVYGTQDNS